MLCTFLCVKFIISERNSVIFVIATNTLRSLLHATMINYLALGELDNILRSKLVCL